MRSFRRGAWARMLVFGVCASFLWMAVGADWAMALDLSGGGRPKCYQTDECGKRHQVACTPDNLGDANDDGNQQGNLCDLPKKSAAAAGGGATMCPPSPNPGTGNLPIMPVPLGFRDLGGPLFSPWFNSQQADASYNMGPKWRSSYHMRLTFPSSTKVTFEDADGTNWNFTKNADGSYTPEAGYHAKLAKVPFLGSYVYILTLANGRLFWFNVNGKLTNVFERDWNAYDAITYDALGRFIRIEVYIKNDQGQYVATGRKLTVAYNASGRISSITDPASRQAQLAYDASGRVHTVTDPAGQVVTYGYDGSDRITSLTLNSHTWQYTYSGDSFVTSIRNPLNQTTTYAYTKHTNGKVQTCTITDPSNHTTVHEFSTGGNLIKVTDAFGNYRTFTYDASKNRISMTNERGQTWYYAHNAYGDMTQVTDPLDNVTQYEYGYNAPDDHLLKRITDPLGHQTNFTYDGGGHLLTVTDPNGNTTTYTYNLRGMLASVTDARGNTTTYAYNSPYSPAYLTSVTDPLDHTTSFEYDSVGNRTSVTDARGNTTYYSHDGKGRVTQITNPDDTTRLFAYNCCNLTSVTDENGKVTTYNYDAAERLASVVDAESDQTSYAYDAAGNLTSVTDANNHATAYTYNANDWLTRIDYPDSTYETFTYYPDGALCQRIDGNGATTTYWRDELDRVGLIDYPNGNGGDVMLQYDAEGRVTRMVDGHADTLYYYDSAAGITKYDQLIAIDRKYGSMTSYRATVYNYDQNYNRTYLRDGEGNETTFAYDDNNQLTEVATGAQTTTFQYDNVGNRTRKDLPNGAYTTYNYGDRDWLTSLENRKDDDSLISSYTYAHDNVGNRTSMTEANGDVTTYLYDDVYRLASEEKRDSAEELLYHYQYTYDGVGNRLTMTNAGEVTYSYDANNKLTQLVGPSGTTTFGYDDNGNMTGMNLPDETVWNYGYDYENRLVSVADNADYTGAYTYSPDGLRLRVQESNHAYPDRWFQYDGVRPVLEGTLADDAFTTVNRYAWERDSYYDPLISASIGGQDRFYLFDGLGSTRQLLDSDEDVTDSYSYEAFGNVLSDGGPTPNPYQYVGSLGYYACGDPHLLHLGARYYMPEIGRFLQRDPRRSYERTHLYAGANPANLVDANGRQVPPPFGDVWALYDFYAHIVPLAAKVYDAREAKKLCIGGNGTVQVGVNKNQAGELIGSYIAYQVNDKGCITKAVQCCRIPENFGGGKHPLAGAVCYMTFQGWQCTHDRGQPPEGG